MVGLCSAILPEDPRCCFGSIKLLDVLALTDDFQLNI